MGVIADTHGLLRPEALAALSGSALLLHAGDVGRPEVLAPLRALAPLHAVRGNVDRGEWAAALPLHEVVDVAGRRLLLLHDVADLDPAVAMSVDAVVCGHSHVPCNETVDGVLRFNPGSAGPRRFRLPVSVGRLVVGAAGVRGEIVHLDVPPAAPRRRGG